MIMLPGPPRKPHLGFYDQDPGEAAKGRGPGGVGDGRRQTPEGLHPDNQPGTGEGVASAHRRWHHSRCHLRQAGAQCLPY